MSQNKSQDKIAWDRPMVQIIGVLVIILLFIVAFASVSSSNIAGEAKQANLLDKTDGFAGIAAGLFPETIEGPLKEKITESGARKDDIKPPFDFELVVVPSEGGYIVKAFIKSGFETESILEWNSGENAVASNQPVREKLMKGETKTSEIRVGSKPSKIKAKLMVKDPVSGNYFTEYASVAIGVDTDNAHMSADRNGRFVIQYDGKMRND